MRMTSGQKKWLQLFFDILDHEFDDGPLLSEAADALVEKRPILGRIVILAGAAAIALHLANLINPKYDVISPDFWTRIKGR